MTTVHVDAEQSAGTFTVIADPDTSGFHIQVPDVTLEVSQAQLTSITQAAMALLGVTTGVAVKPAFFTDSNGLPRTGVTLAQTFPALMSAALGAATYGVFAVAGEKSSDLLARQAAVRAYKPTIVFLDSMINDIAAQTNPDLYESNMRTLITNHLIDGAKVVLMSSIFWAESLFLERQRDIYMPIWRKLAKMPGVIPVDCCTQMAAVTMQKSRADFDALNNSGALANDVQHWSAAGNAKRVLWCKDALGIV